MNPELLAAACEGIRRNRTHGSVAILRSADGVEEGVNMPAESRASLLGGVTVKGDTVLHVVAANGDDTNFLQCASFIMDLPGQLLFARNYNGDTPLHCAARAKKSKMVTHLIGRLATSQNNEMVKDLLRIENRSKETVLHEAVRNGDNDLVEKLLIEDSELDMFPEKGSTPMYLAILLDMGVIAQTLHDKSLANDLCYYSRPNGQNALHAAVPRSQVLTKKLLRWNNDLAAQRDENGSTPLHFAAASQQRWKAGSACRQVFEAYPAALYQADRDGLYPIHVAASSDARFNIAMFVEKCPRSAGLRDAKGRTFLHVAVKKNKLWTVRYACNRNRLFEWILNMQDREGNTALHLAVKEGNVVTFHALFGNRHVNLNLTNAEERSPCEIARIRSSFHDKLDPEVWIDNALRLVGAATGVSRQDLSDENYDNVHGVKSDYETKELEMLKDSTQVQSIGSVLIATMTFGAMFALPGGYRADDHDYGGTPTLAGTDAFHAFVIANTLAFISSTIATLGFIYAGSANISLARHKKHFAHAELFLGNSIVALTIAFALSVYTVLSPVAQKTAILISVMSPSLVLYCFGDFWFDWVLSVKPFLVRIRKGPIWALLGFIWIALKNMFIVSCLFIIIFVWAAYGRNHPISNSVSPAQAPTQFS